MDFNSLTAEMVNDVNISLQGVIIALMSAAACAYIIKLMYDRYGRSLNNRSNFSDHFVLLCIITALVIIVVKNSLALSLGLVGALSIVRFRAAIKEPEELIYLFLVISLGLCFGANQFLLGYLFTFSCVILIFGMHYMRATRTNAEHYSGCILILQGDEKFYKDISGAFSEIAKSHNINSDLKSVSITSNRFSSTYKIDFSSKIAEKNGFLTSLTELKNLEFELINDVTVPE